MTRAKGKHNQRQAVAPDSPEGHDIGLSERQLGTASPIPGGAQHLVRPPVERHSVPIADPRPEFRGVMAHGVPAEKHSAHERAAAMRGPNTTHDPHPVHTPTPPGVAPVPVYVVQTESDRRALRSTSHRKYTVPANSAVEPIRLCGRNSNRAELLLLNEDATHGIRFDIERSALTTAGAGTLLPAAMTGYLKLPTQDELYAISNDGSAPSISVIEVFTEPQGLLQ